MNSGWIGRRLSTEAEGGVASSDSAVVKRNNKIKIKIKNVGQECPTHTYLSG